MRLGLRLLSTAAFAVHALQRPRASVRSPVGVRRFAAPRSKLPSRRVDVSCAGCGAALFRYAKGNGASSRLVKVYAQRIVKDFTEDRVRCPSCGAVFAREATVHGRLAYKIVSGKVRVR